MEHPQNPICHGAVGDGESQNQKNRLGEEDEPVYFLLYFSIPLNHSLSSVALAVEAAQKEEAEGK